VLLKGLEPAAYVVACRVVRTSTGAGSEQADGIVLRTKTGISKVYFAELPKDVQHCVGRLALIKLRSNSATAWSSLFCAPTNLPELPLMVGISRHALQRGGFLLRSSLRLSEIALVLVRLDDVPSVIINADRSIVRAAIMLGIAERSYGPKVL
jgi:hypothetical protein